ncbi:PQQ-binding-like beta-propeller repeat protein [Dysgonomonas sp. Marseille-P4677]|uniref:outer membrane protein assembly factor BamB family protein n=1 Tax=Dysgonomonas sp. Marseille-P4677 TaxID=2364790 RepID=UPI001911F229|nr:PQQ-binding-like beta-propeller repeat protein [Dysgonomonas sp. Marseille-P4677]MBK5722185.1 PQQ-binding-like beta-propeller repeat protein [Dysgonomonas sp. Marseille-P4677]
MKNIILYSLLITVSFLFAACNDENIPEANFETMEASSLKATPGDEEMTLTWEPMEEANPIGYFLSWTASTQGISGGEMSVEGNLLTATIVGLVNGETYTFSVQPQYKTGRGGKISVKSKPTTSRMPVKDVVAVAGNERIRVQWTKPVGEKLTGYKLTVNPTGQVIEINNPATESYIISGLTNGIEYTLSLVCVYSNGNSDLVNVVATPGNVTPIIVSKQYLLPNESMVFQYNDMFFMGTVASASWSFGDSGVSAELSPSHTYTAGGQYEAKVKVTYTDGTSESGSMQIYVIDYAWKTVLQTSGVYGQVKASTPVFGLDGTVYISISGPSGKGDLIAVNPSTGTINWTYPISAVTYGGGPSVGSDGTIYTGARNKVLYAINPNGSLKWSYTTGENVDCFPAISQDGTVYIVSNDLKLYSLKSDGSLKWSKQLDGAKVASAIAINSDGKILAGTDSYIYAFDSSGNELWKTAANATEISTFAINNGALYIPLKAGKGLMALSVSSGSELWTYGITGSGNDAYSPIVGKDGAIYFAGKNGKVFYAVNADGSKKWEFATDANMVYVSPVIDEKGIIYFGTDKNNSNKGQIFALNSLDGSVCWKMETSTDGRFMSGTSVGPDKKLYMGSLGSGNSTDPGQLLAIPIYAGPETSTWSARGGNIYGNSNK